jgi:hypothetical protein
MGIGQLVWLCAAIEEMDSIDSRIVTDELRAEMKSAETNAKSFRREPGETLAEFAARDGISEAAAEILMQGARPAAVAVSPDVRPPR